MYPTRAQRPTAGRPLPPAAANAPSHAEHCHRQSSVQITLHDCWPAAGWGDRLPTISQRITVRRLHNRKTIGLKLSAGVIVVR